MQKSDLIFNFDIKSFIVIINLLKYTNLFQLLFVNSYIFNFYLIWKFS